MDVSKLKDWEINELYLKYGPTLSPPVTDKPEVKKPTVSSKKRYRTRCNYHNPLPNKKGYDRDHIVPVSFCYELGVSDKQACHPDNVKYIPSKDNKNKFSFITEEVKCHLNKMCSIWGIPVPDNDTIKKWNNTQERYAKYFLK